MGGLFTRCIADFVNELYKAVQKTEKTIAIHATDIHFQQFRRNMEQLSKLSEKLEELSQKD